MMNLWNGYKDILKLVSMFKKSNGAKTVPQILVNGEWVGGYSDFEEVMESF